MEREAEICASRAKAGLLDAQALLGDEDYLPSGVNVEVCRHIANNMHLRPFVYDDI